MSTHKSKSELRINVVDDHGWPALQTPQSLWPRDVTLDDDNLSYLRLTPSVKDGFVLSVGRTPTTSHTFGFPMSPLSVNSRTPPENSDSQSPLEKHKRRFRRYHTAEALLTRLPNPPALCAADLFAQSTKFALRSLAVQVANARLNARAIRLSGRRDDTRWMAEHQLAALEALQVKLGSEWRQTERRVDHLQTDRFRRCEANLVRFLGVRRGEGLVPVFTRARAQRQNRELADAAAQRRCMTVGSPMKLQTNALPAPPAARAQWSWETRVRAVLLYPVVKPSVSPRELRTETPTSLSTPTSSSYSPIEPQTPLIGPYDEDEINEDDEDEYEDYPVFPSDSAQSYPLRRHPREQEVPSSKPPPRPQPHRPPLVTNFSPDANYAWLADPSSWASPNGWHGDGWEVNSASASSASSTASPTSVVSPATPSTAHSSISSAPSSARVLTPRTPTRSQTLHSAPGNRFWTRERSRRPPSLRPIVEARDAVVYATKALPAPPSSAVLPPPPAPHPQQKKGRQFFAGLVRRMQADPARESAELDAANDRTKLKKQGSLRSMRSSRSGRSSSLSLRD